jgi:hypothetical protein
MNELEVTSSSNVWNSEYREEKHKYQLHENLKYSEYKENKNTSIKKYQLHDDSLELMNIWAFIYLKIEAWRDHLIAQII